MNGANKIGFLQRIKKGKVLIMSSSREKEDAGEITTVSIDNRTNVKLMESFANLTITMEQRFHKMDEKLISF